MLLQQHRLEVSTATYHGLLNEGFSNRIDVEFVIGNLNWHCDDNYNNVTLAVQRWNNFYPSFLMISRNEQ